MGDADLLIILDKIPDFNCKTSLSVLAILNIVINSRIADIKAKL